MLRKKYTSIGACGLDCGLCPKHNTDDRTKCPGCYGLDFFDHHPSCAIIRCCVEKKNLEVCGECDSFPCQKYSGFDDYDTFITYRNAMSNMMFVKENSIKELMEQQKKRIGLLKAILEQFDDGRSKSMFCIAAALLPLPELRNAVRNSKETIISQRIDEQDMKRRAQILKGFLSDCASREGVELKLRKKKSRRASVVGD